MTTHHIDACPPTILGPDPAQWELDVAGYSLLADAITGHACVYVWAKDQLTGGHVNLFITPADAREFAAQLVAAADSIDPEGATR